MTLNLLGGSSYFGGNSFDESGLNKQNLMDTKERAVLYVFTPTRGQFTNVGLRPFQYTFDDNFVAQTEEITDLARRGTATASSVVRDLRQRTNLNDLMTPSLQSNMEFEASKLSDFYRFILVFTESSKSLISANVMAHSLGNGSVRRIYTGFFQEEPFNPSTFSESKRSLNPNAVLVITHKTVLGMTTEHGRFGAKTRLNTKASEEIIHPVLSQNLITRHDNSRDTALHLMTPENCMNAIESDGYGHSVAIPGLHSKIQPDGNADVLVDLFEQPAHNVGHIVKGMLRFQDNVTQRRNLPMYRNEQMFDDMFDAEHRSALAREMGLPRAAMASPFDLDINNRVSVTDIDTMVRGDLDILDFNLQRPMFYDTADQMENSFTNQFSFLIASVIGPILNAAGLNSLQFQYQVANIQGQTDENYEVYGAESSIVMSNQDTIEIVRAVQIELSRGIFDTIFKSMGAFHVYVSAFATGITTVRLSLVDQGYVNKVDFELPSCLGGLVSPLIGDSVVNAANSERIEMLYNVATGTQNTVRMFNDEERRFADDKDKAFADRALELAWDGPVDEVD